MLTSLHSADNNSKVLVCVIHAVTKMQIKEYFKTMFVLIDQYDRFQIDCTRWNNDEELLYDLYVFVISALIVRNQFDHSNPERTLDIKNIDGLCLTIHQGQLFLTLMLKTYTGGRIILDSHYINRNVVHTIFLLPLPPKQNYKNDAS